jgi:hypothetical protein
MCKGSINNLKESINRWAEQGLNNDKCFEKRAQKQELSSKCTKGPIYRKLVCYLVIGLRSNAGHAFDRTDACVRSYPLRSNANNCHGT